MDANFTVAICTLNRRLSLRRTIGVVLDQLSLFPNGRLLVVDNGSSDGTQQDLAELAEQHSFVAWTSEARRGLYFARAKAIDSAAGDHLVFLDDDAVPQAGWLEGLLEVLASRPSVGIVGCSIDPLWEIPRPTWLTLKLENTLTIFDSLEGPSACKFPRYPAGICLALRRNECARLYAANTRRDSYCLGRTYQSNEFDGSLPLGGEDNDLCEIYARNGFEVLLIPSVRVAHAVPAQRLTKEWLYLKFAGDGHTRIRLLRAAGYRPFSYGGRSMLLSLPIFFLMRPIRPLMSEKVSVLVEAYYQKCLGAWREVLKGPKIVPFPYKTSAD